MPFGDYTGGAAGDSGFTSNEDGAQANLYINMSDDDARTLWDVQAAVQQIATDFQTAVRAASDFHSYLISIRETSSTIRLPELGMAGNAEGNLPYAGGRVDSGSVPALAASGEASMAARLGEMGEIAAGMGVSGGALAASEEASAGGGRVSGPLAGGGGSVLGEATNLLFLGQMFRGGGRRGEPQPTPAPGARRPLGRGQVAYNVSSRARTAVQGATQTAGTLNSFLRGGGIATIGGLLSRTGAWGAAIAGAGLAVNEGFETYARSRATAIAANNINQSSGWGFEQELNQQMMALSPFISGEEAAQIFSESIQQGWASGRGGPNGPTFGQATNFAYTNAKDYNISVADSMQLLDQNVGKAGQSIADLSEQLLTLKQVSEGSGIALSTVVEGALGVNNMLINRGANPGQSFLLGTATSLAFKGNPILQNSGGDLYQRLFASPTATAIVASRMGELPWQVFGEGENVIATGQQYSQLMTEFVRRAINEGSSPSDRNGRLVAYAAAIGYQITPLEAEGYIHQYKNTGTVSFDKVLGEAQEASKAKFETRSNWNVVGGAFHGDLGVNYGGGGVGDTFKAGDLSDDEAQRYADVDKYAARTYSPEVEALFNASEGGARYFQLRDKSGKIVAESGMIRAWLSKNEQNRQQFLSDQVYLYNTRTGDSSYGSTIGAPGNTPSAKGGDLNVKGTLTLTLNGRMTSANTVAIDGTGSQQNKGEGGGG